MGKTFALGAEPGREGRQQGLEEPGLAEEIAALRPLSREEQLEHLVVESRRRGPDNGIGGGDQGRAGFLFDGKAELGGKAHRTQHPYRVFLEADGRITDGANDAGVEVGETAGVIHDRKIGDTVGERVDGEVTAQGILCGGAVDVVPQDHAIVVLQHARMPLPLFRLVGRFRFGFRLVRGLGTKGRHLDDLVLEVDVGQAKASPDETAIAEYPFHLARGGVGDHIEILRLPAEQEVAHTAADKIADKAVVLQAVENTQGVLVHELAGNAMFLAGDDHRTLIFFFEPVTVTTFHMLSHLRVAF